MNHIKLVFLSLLLFISILGNSLEGFLHAEGKNIVNGQGENVLLRGIGLGGWMLQEGYLLEMSGFANPQHEIEAAIESVAGAVGKEQFYNAWLENYCTKADVDSIANWGFNSMRLPMHYNLFTLPIEEEPVAGQDTWLNKGFEMVDELLEWCGDNEIYLILDLHAAPGGQGKDAAISDYDESKPSLWESAENRRKTIALWKKLAERYADEPWIGGYEPINEPNWDIDNAGNENGCNCNQNTALWNLYKDIISAIREVDTNHMVILGGNCWGNNYNGIPAAGSFDSNLVLSFHKYATYNDEGSIQWMLNLRNIHNVPVWLGEAGENSNVWFASAIKLVESYNIGWAWWPFKKIGSVTCPVTIPKTNNYQSLLNYWNNGGSKPSEENATAWLLEQAEMMRLENCIIRYDVLDAMFRQAQGDKAPKPFKTHHIPGTIFATDYDLGGNGYVYFDQDTADYRFSTDVYTAWNSGWTYRNDGVDIEECEDVVTNGYSVGWTQSGEWLLYTVEVDSTAGYTCEIRYSANSSIGRIHLEVDNLGITTVRSLPSTGGWYNWSTLTINEVILQKGTHQLKFFVDNEGFNINSISFLNPVALTEISPEIIQVKTNSEGDGIFVVTNLGFSPGYNPRFNDFLLTINGHTHPITDIDFYPGDSTALVLRIDRELIKSDVINLSYNGTSLVSPWEEVYPIFESTLVDNFSPNYVVMPAKIEAEDFWYNYGYQTEDCSDSGGGLNLAYANTGDYADYLIFSEEEKSYAIEYRLASNVTGRFRLDLIHNDEITSLQTINVSSTGGWQNWTTVLKEIELPAGKSILRLYALSGEFNVNWFRVKYASTAQTIINNKIEINAVYSKHASALTLLPNTNIEENCQLYLVDLSGRKILSKSISFNGKSEMTLPGIQLKNCAYILSVKMNEMVYTQKIVVY
ncbi:MAG: carbohydrate-binding protein [Prolixibacteraceae bacterium]|nr:carbohydrate-binding protein [Prolixibacteraceae bacterium]